MVNNSKIENLSDNERQIIKDLWISGSPRNKIAKIIGKDNNTVQAYINYIRPTYENERNDKLEKTKRIHIENLNENEVKELYLKGASTDYLKSKFHIGSHRVSKIIKSYSNEEIKIHNDNTISFGKENAKQINNQYISNLDIEHKEEKYITKEVDKIINNRKIKVNRFFGKKIKNFEYDYYCKIEFTNEVKIYRNSSDSSKYGNTKEIPSTAIMTKGIKSKGDYITFLDIRDAHIFDIKNEYCYNVNSKSVLSLTDMANILDIDIDEL